MRDFLPFFLLLLCLHAATTTAHAVPPNAPSALVGHFPTHTSAALSWTDNSNNESGFLIGIRNSPFESFSLLGPIAANRTSVEVTGLDPDTPNYFVIVALNAAQEQSDPSNTILLRTPPIFRALYTGRINNLSLANSGFRPVSSYAISALPPGLSLDPASGLISGIPTVLGRTNTTVTLTMTAGGTISYPLALRIFNDVPVHLSPTAGPSLPNLTLPAASSPAPISFATLFTDPDVSSAARLTTDLGPIDFAFYPGSAPATVTNFLGYMNRGDFTNTIFHRSIPGFIIQAGAFRADATGSAVTTQAPVVNEPNVTNVRGTIAMAKVGGNPNSATNQFFINLGDNAFNLDNQNDGFTVFGRVAGNGMALADAIAALPTRNYSAINGAFTDTPVRGTPPASYDPTTLVRISNVAPVAPLSYSVASSAPTIATASLTGTDLTLSPLQSGTTTITITATDLDNQTANSSFLLTVTDAYDQWAATQSFPAPADALPGADPDNDGLINLTEFALPSAPLAATASNTIPALAEGHLTLAFPLRTPLTGTRVALQSAATLTGPWTDRWTSTDGLTHPWIASHLTTGDTTQVTARDPAPLNPDNRFLRLKITRP